MLALRGLAGDLVQLLRVLRRGWPEPTAEVRVAVVMGAQVLSGGRPSRTLGARTRHAARLYRKGELDLLIPTGGTGEHPPSEARIMSEILSKEGVPQSAVVLEDGALSTWDSAWLVADILRRRGIGEVRVVTDPLHCVRTLAAFREAGIVAWAEPVYASPMWRGRSLRLGQFARETVALAWYRTRHGVGTRSRR